MLVWRGYKWQTVSFDECQAVMSSIYRVEEICHWQISSDSLRHNIHFIWNKDTAPRFAAVTNYLCIIQTMIYLYNVKGCEMKSGNNSKGSANL